MKHFFQCAAAACFLLLTSGDTAAQEVPGRADTTDIVVVEHADSLVGLELEGERIRQLIGNVRFRHGRTVVTCQRATQRLRTNRVAMDGLVEVRDDSMRMVSTRGTYDGSTRVAEAFEGVLVEEPGTVLRAEHGTYYLSERRAEFGGKVRVEDSVSVLESRELTHLRDSAKSIARGNVVLRSPRNGLTITGGLLENWRRIRYSRVTEHPRLVQVDTAGGGTDTLTVTALVLESYRDSVERLVATDSVLIIRGGLAAVAGRGTFFTARDSITLEDSPFVWYAAGAHRDNQVAGDSIFVRLASRKLEQVTVRGRAVAISRADTARPDRFNQMTGAEIILRFGGEQLQSIDVNRTATSLYYLFDKGSPNGMNKTSGDNVRMVFREGRLARITVLKKVEGHYYPERLIRGRESLYNLEGFTWRERPRGRLNEGSIHP